MVLACKLDTATTDTHGSYDVNTCYHLHVVMIDQ